MSRHHGQAGSGSGSESATLPAGTSVPAPDDRPVLFVDGHCVLCNWAAQWVVDRDHAGRIGLATLQGRTAARLLPGRALAGNTLVLRVANGQISTESTAVLTVCRLLGGRFRVLTVLRVLPRWLRDGLYRWVARNRYRWFGRTESCRLPNAGDRSRLLD